MNTDPEVLQSQFEEYLEYMRKHGKSQDSITSYRKTYNLFIKDGYTYIDTDNVERFLTRYPNAATFNKVLNHLRSFQHYHAKRVTLSTGQYKWTTDTAVPFLIEQRKVQVCLPETVEDDQADKLVAALKARHLKTWAFLVLKKNTGLRFSEVLDLRSQHLRRMEGGVLVVQFFGKGGQERIVPLNGAAQEAFAVWIRGRWFPHEDTIRWHWKQAEKEAGLTHVRPHWFRHTVATKLANKDISYERIADLLGNTVEVARSRYRRMNAFKLSEATELL